MDVIEAINTRRSVRHYSAQPVGEDTLHKVLEAARRAPSWANTQCWRFIVVSDDSVKAELAQSLISLYKREGYPTNPAAKALTQAPVIIVACAEEGVAGLDSDGAPATDKGDWYMFDIALAMQNLVLAAWSLGLGTVYIGAFDAEKAAVILGVPAGFRVVAMTPLGYPEREGRVTPRKELSEIVFRDKFGQPLLWQSPEP